MFENNTDRMFWTIAVLILGATLLMIGNKAFPNVQDSIMSTISQNVKSSDGTADKAQNSMTDAMNKNYKNIKNSSLSTNAQTKQSDSNASKKEDAEKLQDYDYDYNSDGTINLMWYHKNNTEVTVPKWGPAKNEDVNNPQKFVEVTTMNGDDSFALASMPFPNKAVTKVTLPDSIRKIGIGAFYQSNLQEINIPDSVTTISEQAFIDNNLTSVKLPNTLTSLGAAAFQNNKLKSVNIPNNLKILEERTFYNNQLTSVSLPDSVKTVEDGVFYKNQLNTLNLETSRLERVGDYAFAENYLTNKSFPKSLQYLGVSSFHHNKVSSINLPDHSIYDKGFGYSVYMANGSKPYTQRTN